MALERPEPSDVCVLVVDDVDTNRRLIEILMRGEGYDVAIAGTGREALERVADRRPDVIILDLALPDMHGSALIARLRELGVEIPVLVVSGDTTPPARWASLQAAEYLTKPYDVDSLVQAVAKLLESTSQEV